MQHISLKKPDTHTSTGVVSAEILQHNFFIYFKNTSIRNMKRILYISHFHGQEKDIIALKSLLRLCSLKVFCDSIHLMVAIKAETCSIMS